MPRGRWQYGYYLGREEGIAKIGLSPEGPPVIWTHGFYPEVQGAYVEVIPETGGSKP